MTMLLFNEPGVSPIFGYGFGRFAPGYNSLKHLGQALHHVNLARGRAFRANRDNAPADVKISSAFNILYRAA